MLKIPARPEGSLLEMCIKGTFTASWSIWRKVKSVEVLIPNPQVSNTPPSDRNSFSWPVQRWAPFFSNYWFILFLSSDTDPYNHACSVVFYSELTANYTHTLSCVCLCFFFLSRNSSSLKMFTSRTRRIFRAMWTEWSRTLGNWNLKSRTTRTRVRTFTQHINTPGT